MSVNIYSYFERRDSEYNLEDKWYKKYEVFFRYSFTSVYPHKHAVETPMEASVFIPINKLFHITHNKEAFAIIKENGSFHFKPKQKMGKAYKWDGSPKGVIPR